MKPDASWTLEVALLEIARLTETAQQLLDSEGYGSSEWNRWRANARTLFLGVCGPDSPFTADFLRLHWKHYGQVILDPDEMRRSDGRGLMGTNQYFEILHRRAAEQSLVDAVGILQGLADELERRQDTNVFVSHDTGEDAAELVRILRLAESGLRKSIRSAPSIEKDVQDSFENLLIGAQVTYSRESEYVEYSSKTYKPDFTVDSLSLAIEIKICKDASREKDIIAEINDDILAYQTRWKSTLFVVYDIGNIRDVDRFIQSFEAISGVLVRVVKH